MEVIEFEVQLMIFPTAGHSLPFLWACGVMHGLHRAEQANPKSFNNSFGEYKYLLLF